MSTTKVILSVLIGAFILFVWNAVSWMALPFHSNTLNNIPSAAMDAQVLKQHMPTDGVYHYPGMPADNSAASMKAVQDKLSEGPRITMMVYQSGSSTFMDPKLFMGGFVINLLTAMVALFLMMQLKSKDLRTILLASLGIGLAAALVCDIAQMNWYLFPLDYTLANVFDRLISFALLGIFFAMYTFKGVRA